MLAKINKIQHQKSGNFFLMAGPCAIESEAMAMEIAEKILTITNKLEMPFIFKGSYRKANRSRLDSFTGIGDMEALEILKKVGERFNVPTVTDIHAPEEAAIGHFTRRKLRKLSTWNEWKKGEHKQLNQFYDQKKVW